MPLTVRAHPHANLEYLHVPEAHRIHPSPPSAFRARRAPFVGGGGVGGWGGRSAKTRQTAGRSATRRERRRRSETRRTRLPVVQIRPNIQKAPANVGGKMRKIYTSAEYFCPGFFGGQ